MNIESRLNESIKKNLTPMTWEEKFEIYHAQNTHVYEHFKRFAKQAKSSGMDKFSAKAVFERLRWHLYFETVDEQPFKLNNSYTAYYSRKLMDEHPEFRGFFETRSR